MRWFFLSIASAAVFSGTVVLSKTPAAAHPHVQIKVETVVVVENGAVTGFRHKWTFDKAYLTSVLDEFDSNGDRKLDATEQAKLVAHTRGTLKRFDSFTVGWTEARKLKLKTAKNIKMTLEDDGAVLQFTIDLAKPVALIEKGFRFEVYDATYFSAFDFAGASAVSFSEHASPDCSLTIERPSDGEQLTAYRAFSKEFGPMAAALVKPAVVVVKCANLRATSGEAE